MKVSFFNSTVEKFVKNLEPLSYSKVLRTIELLELFGKDLKMPYSKALKNKLFELRTKGKQEVRIIYTFHNKEAILLHGFIKKSYKIPKKDIKLARSRQNTLVLNIT